LAFVDRRTQWGVIGIVGIDVKEESRVIRMICTREGYALRCSGAGTSDTKIEASWVELRTDFVEALKVGGNLQRKVERNNLK
jgi:hypothetical protein